LSDWYFFVTGVIINSNLYKASFCAGFLVKSTHGHCILSCRIVTIKSTWWQPRKIEPHRINVGYQL